MSQIDLLPDQAPADKTQLSVEPGRIVRIAIPCPLYQVFDYIVPDEDLSDDPSPGNLTGRRARVSFGRQRVVGIIVDEVKSSTLPRNRLKPVIKLLDQHNLLGDELLQLLHWASRYYVCPLGEALQTALPSYLRNHDDNSPALSPCWRLTQTHDNDAVDEQLHRAPRQRQLYHWLQETPPDQLGLDADAFNALTNNWRAPLNALIEKGIVKRFQQPAVLRPRRDKAPEPTLNDEQRQAVDNIGENLHAHSVHLIDGITGSGKTEVYLALCDKVLASGRQVLVLVPEIGLTPQLTQRFLQRLESTITVLHSAMNDRQRYAGWHAAATQQAKLVIGTRSSVFTPLPELGLIIIDEEHDGSYKQQDGFRYNARDLAIVRARNLNIPVVLGSATPSLETLNNTNEQRYIAHYLKQRANQRALPSIELVNACSQKLNEGIADSMLTSIRQHLEQQGQVLLFINRRGFAPLLMCHECGWTTRCQSCDANMTYHKGQHRLHCHHCGAQRRAPERCESCGEDDIIAVGAGTERIEQFLQQQFNGYQVSRIDRDTTRRKGSLQAKLAQAHSGESDILVGTQMLAKGHDFPNITLVCILDTDQALFSADFRASEHLAQLITQVSGRAGRADKPGHVLIQTHHPEHPLLQTLLHQGYQAFAGLALQERQCAGLPPKRFLTLLRCESVTATAAETFLSQALEQVNTIEHDDIDIFGPLPAPMERRAGRYRYQVMLQCGQRKKLIALLNWWAPLLQQMKSARQVRWSIDVDPYDTF